MSRSSHIGSEPRALSAFVYGAQFFVLYFCLAGLLLPSAYFTAQPPSCWSGLCNKALTNCGSTVYSSTTTNASGDFTLGTTGGSYTQATDRIGFTLAAGSSDSGRVFGGVPQPMFTTDGVKQVAPGQSVCILARVNSPAGAAEGVRDVTTVTLSEVLTPVPQGGAISRTMTHTDTTTVAQTGLTLSKQVRKVATCPATAAASLADGTVYTTSNNAKPGDYLEYLLSYRNDAGMPVTAVRVADTTPAYTRFKQTLCLSTPAVGVSGCAVTTQPALDATGSVLWTITDAATAPVGVQPGASGSVSYCVQVVP